MKKRHSTGGKSSSKYVLGRTRKNPPSSTLLLPSHYIQMNPFMVTTNENYGLALNAANKVYETIPASTKENISSSDTKKSTTPPHDLSFLMSRESDRFGEGTSYSDSALSRVFREKESDPMNKRRKDSSLAKQSFDSVRALSKTVSKEEVKDILVNYSHSPKKQHPLYTTEANVAGMRKPTEASFSTARYGLSQHFSQSFNRTMYRDEGLNSSMTKSKIHDQLTPQFI